MFVVRVIPIARGVFKDELSFFAREQMPAGSVIAAAIRGKRIPCLVIESSEAREERLSLRTAGYALKKLPPGTKARRIFSDAFIRAGKDAALWHGAHEGTALAQLTSQLLLAAAARLEEAPAVPSSEKTDTEEVRVKADRLVLQAERGERMRTYRNLAREAFARKSSVILIAPTVAEAEGCADELSRGIEERVILITGELPKKKLITHWNRAVSSAEPILIVGTPLALSVPRRDADTIIVERESARAYRRLDRPHLDLRYVALRLSVRSGARLIIADFPVRVETRYLVDVNRADELARAQARPGGSAEARIVDARASEEVKRSKRAFSAITEATMKRIGGELARGGRVVVFAARRGIAPMTVCNDCGTPVTDPAGAPMVLHKTTKGNVFLSHRSGATLPAHTSCRTCGGWNLTTLGIGIERVEADVEKAFPKANIFMMTAENAPTHAKAKKLAQEFFKTPGAVMVGTERMLPYLAEPVELAVVASIDSFLSLPAWRAHEHALAILFYLRERADTALIVETREPKHLVMQTLASGNPADFYRADLAERERYGYPPFTLFVGLTMRGTPAAIEKLRLLVKETFADTDLVGPLAAEQVDTSQWLARAVIRLPRSAWPDEALTERLKALPPAIEVTIDPDEIV